MKKKVINVSLEDVYINKLLEKKKQIMYNVRDGTIFKEKKQNRRKKI